MSDQREIHIDHRRLQQFLYGEREECLLAFRGMDGVFSSDVGNASEEQEKIVRMVTGSADQYRKFLTMYDDRSVQILSLAFADIIVAHAGKDAPDFSMDAFEAALNSRDIVARECAERLATKYLDYKETRAKIMSALSAEMMLNRNWERCGVYRNIATYALRYSDSRETAISVIGGVLSYENAQIRERESALLTLWALLRKGVDITVAEKDIRKIAENRKDPLFEHAKSLIADAKMLNFNRPEATTLKLPTMVVPQPAMPLRVARSASA